MLSSGSSPPQSPRRRKSEMLPTPSPLSSSNPWADDPTDLEEKIAAVSNERKVRKCPKGHETGVREIGTGRFMCSLCGRKWTEGGEE